MKAVKMRAGSLCMALATAGIVVTVLQACVPVVATGVATSVTATVDRRSYGAQVEDTNLELKIFNTLRERLGNKASIGVTSYNRWVLLTGQVQDEATRAEAIRLANAETNVRKVYSETAIAASPTLGGYSNDTYITAKVKARLLDTHGISANNVKVVTETGVTYLMGLLTQREADLATRVTATTAGVQKVIQVFEIISDEDARRLSPPPAQSAPPANTRDTPN